MFYITICLIFALLLDRLLGEPEQLHPLVGFGKLATHLEKKIHSNLKSSSGFMFIKGMLAWMLAVFPITLGIVYLNSVLMHQNWIISILLNTIGLYFCIGAQSLDEHISAIRDDLLKNDMITARINLSKVVSRDTGSLNETQIAAAAIESTLENGNDAVFAAIFWFAIGGLPAAVAYRLINTLDAIWGYKNEHYFYFGKFAARADDVMNFVPARLTALSYCIMGKFRSGWLCWRQQAKQWKSPNAGPVMAAGAGALQIKLGGYAIYHGSVDNRPELGCGREPNTDSITSALTLIHKALLLWTVVTFLLELIHAH
jgi:adenosylcobinamide-phosphate synthase